MMIMYICLVIFSIGISKGFGQPINAGTIAFTKGLTSHRHLLSGEIIYFNKDISIVNSRFDGNGKFVCSTPGIYSFHVFSLTMEDVNLWIEVYKNNQLVASLFGNTPHDYADAGNSVILHLTTGDTVYVKASPRYQTHLYGLNDQVYTTFTGVLLHPDSQAAFASHEAFSVGLTHHTHLVHGEVVVYNDIITDVRTSSGYDILTGRYIAPTEGIYIFFYHSLATNGKALWLEMYHNGDYVNSAFGRTAGRFGDSGNCAILHLKAGDTVYIKGRNEYGVDLYGGTDEIYNIFSGAMLSTVSSHLGAIGETAFSAGLTHHFSGSRLVFDKIFLNTGNYYDQFHGVFTAPSDGIYVFYYYALAQQDGVIYVDLYRNHQYVNSLYGHTPNDYAAGGNAAVLDLLYGDTVYLSVRDVKSKFYGGHDQIYCTFSGYYVGPNPSLGPIG